MAAPGVTARTIPTGFKMPDGFKTTIAMAENPGVQFWEMTVKPMTVDGGELIPTTSQLNVAWRTFAPKSLKTGLPVTGKAFYDPNVIPELIAMINVGQAITVHLPTNATIAFWGVLQKYEFEEQEEGKSPMLTYTIGVTNWDPVNNVEAGPVYTPAGGTS
jgi:hypothetical protein